jgi:quercetin dioxygenase-like cupin family protein
MKRVAPTIFLFLTFPFVFEAAAQKSSDGQVQIFPKGQKVPGEMMTGNVWLYDLIQADSIYNYHIASVAFEPGARTNWHVHPGGQVLLVTEGSGYYQEKGKPARIIRKGEVVKCAPGIEHWHGASPESSLTHIGITNNTDKGRVVWLKPVSEKEYTSPK